jgi:hypothetical protein
MNNLRIDKRHNGVYLTCDRGMVAQMLAGYSQTQEEDARILAAAPSLLAALKDAAHVLEPLVQSSEYGCYGYAYDKIIAAITNAEGRP